MAWNVNRRDVLEPFVKAYAELYEIEEDDNNLGLHNVSAAFFNLTNVGLIVSVAMIVFQGGACWVALGLLSYFAHLEIEQIFSTVRREEPVEFFGYKIWQFSRNV